MALVTKGTCLVYLGQAREGMALLNGAYLDASAHGLHTAALRAGVNLAANLADTDPRLSLQWTRSGMVLARRLGLTSFDTYHASNTGAAARMGEWAWMREAIGELLESHPDKSSVRWIEDMLLWQDVWRGNDVGGRPGAMIQHAEAAGDPQELVNGCQWALEEAFAREDFAAADTFGRRLLEHEFAGPNIRFWAGRAALHNADRSTAERVLAMIEPSIGGSGDGDLAALRAGLAALDGRVDDAIAGYRTALTVYRDMGLRFDVAITGLDMAALLGPGEPTVRAAAAEAHEILVELGATPVVERLDRLMADGTGAPDGNHATARVGSALRPAQPA
jgi:hypothetical protein